MKVLIYVVIFLVTLFYMAGPEIQFSPFKIHFSRIWSAIGFLFMAIGILFILLQGYREGHLEGYGKGCEDMSKAIIENLKEEKK